MNDHSVRKRVHVRARSGQVPGRAFGLSLPVRVTFEQELLLANSKRSQDTRRKN
jgi:hypothetical protein